MKVALVHDWLTNWGGAERCLEIFSQIFPQAPVYTAVFDPARIPQSFKEKIKIIPSFIQRLPGAKKKYRSYLSLMPFAFERFDLRKYDLILSSSHAVAKGVRVAKNTCHICYCHTPMRYAWSMYDYYITSGKMNPLAKMVAALLMRPIRAWDKRTAKRVNYFIANSKNVAGRIKKFYHRSAEVIYPPVDTDFFTPSTNDEGFYLVVSRLVPYKRVGLAVEAFNELGLPLKVIGDGPELTNLKRIARDNIEFLGLQSDAVVRDHYQRCHAFIFGGEEDFGITPVQALACGKPVIAYGVGGVKETVVDGETGIFFPQQSPEALVAAVKKLDSVRLNRDKMHESALKFGKEVFREKIAHFVEEKFVEFRGKQTGE